MPKDNLFRKRCTLVAKLNDIEAKIPIIVAATGEELSLPESHFKMTEEEKRLSRLQLFIKKAKMFTYDGKQATTKITGLACKHIFLYGKRHQMAPNSIMQNEVAFSTVKEKANQYLDAILKIPTKENKAETHLSKMVDRLYNTIKRSCPLPGEVIHLATMERDLSAPDASKNRLTAEFSTLLAAELRDRIALNNDSWTVELDRVLGLKQRTSRAESYGIGRIAQQPLILYQSRNIEEEIKPKEKVIIVDDHVQAGAAAASSASEVIESNADLLAIVCISAHKNSQVFNIQQDVKDFIISLLHGGSNDIPLLNDILNIVGLNLEILTNVEGMILASILSDSKNIKHKSVFENFIKKYDASNEINHPIFENQPNSLLDEFEKPKITFADLKNELMIAVQNGRYTVPYEKHIIISDENGQNIRKEINSRSNLPWLLFDFDHTLHNLDNNTFLMFQDIIKSYSSVDIPLETIKQTRLTMKETGQYTYQKMILAFIKQYNPDIEISTDEITKAYQIRKNEEPFVPKMSKEDFLALRSKYRIGIITDGTEFESKVPKIKAVYGVDLDGYIHNDRILAPKPSPAMFHEFCRVYDVKDKPVAYIGDSDELDGGMSKNANLKFIKVDPMQSVIDMEKFTKELNAIEEQRKTSRMRWNFLRNVVVAKNSTVVESNTPQPTFR